MAASVYIAFAIGIPVYFHYCGGELEKIQFLTKSTSCCGDEEEDPESGDNGCCNDEEVLVQIKDSALLKHYKTLFHVSFITLRRIQQDFSSFAPQQLQHFEYGASTVSLSRSTLLSTFILRI